jgi:hypothetical protein
MYGSDPLGVITTQPIGARLVVRYRLGDGATDALGYLLERTDTECVVDTKRGPVPVPLADVIAAKTVPAPPPPRPRRSGTDFG